MYACGSKKATIALSNEYYSRKIFYLCDSSGILVFGTGILFWSTNNKRTVLALFWANLLNNTYVPETSFTNKKTLIVITMLRVTTHNLTMSC